MRSRVSNNILQIYNPAIFYYHRTSLCLLTIFKTNKILNAGTCTPTRSILGAVAV